MTSETSDHNAKSPIRAFPDPKSSLEIDDDAKTFSLVAIGASAGGLEACKALIVELPPSPGMAFILVMHLDPTHESMIVELLSGQTSLKVLQASEGEVVEPNHFYVIPPGADLSVEDGRLHVSPPRERHGARLPFDFLLRSVAAEFRERAICVILSGTGADGSAGLKSIREQGGLIVSQDPDEAVYDGMPRSAVMTGAVDLVLPVARIPDALVKYDHGISLRRAVVDPDKSVASRDWLTEIITLLRGGTAHDFAPYKQGTLRRRIERRMAIAAIAPDDMNRYFDLLRGDRGELDLLAKDLLINVTSFFRDPKVFDLVGDKVVPDLLKAHLPDRALRAWIAGCSTGEEAYSLAIIFREAMSTLKLNLKLQIFASDVDPDAISIAREGVYPFTIESDVSAERLARFFTREDQGYRVSSDIRSLVVFTVQDILADPPFARLDLISCRNLLIYLLPEAQAKVISLFHFALREGGALLLGNSETAGETEGRFEVISKPARIYRQIGRSHPREIGFSLSPFDESRTAPKRAFDGSGARQLPLADICRRMVLECYAPAAILINHNYECLYSLGPTDRYLSIPQGHATHDFLSMAPKGIRARLRAAIQRANQESAKTILDEISVGREGEIRSFKVEIHPVLGQSRKLLLICFVDAPRREWVGAPHSPTRKLPGFSDLEQELESTRVELRNAVHELESSAEEQKTINEEASSVNEEFQATNEELLASKEELQSLNEELTALNGQLQETLERQRTTGNDLQNVLNSTDVATLFLDTHLNIRLFTPATRLLFSIIPGDVGRPLADLNSLAADVSLSSDAETVLRTLAPVEREIEARTGAWYMRRILPYRVPDGGVGGVVITFADITERRRVSEALEDARRQSQLANVAKSKFLAAASHDLRQPLQALSLLQGLLARSVSGEREKKLVGRIDDTVLAMSGMLNALLDINQIEAGTVNPELADFPINDILLRLRDEFDYTAKAKGLVLRVAPCGLCIRSDPRLLEQMIRNLLANAVKYTTHGKILLGCRRKAATLDIQIKDTGIGIPETELEAIFDEYHQIGNPARERSRGLGLGLSIVQRVAVLLGHRISVRSILGKGSTFTIEAPRAHGTRSATPIGSDVNAILAPRRSGVVLIVEDDPDIREPLEMLLLEDGHVVATASDGISALSLISRGAMQPDLVLADFNLPNGLNGLQLIASIREHLHVAIPAIVLTGDIATDTLRDIAAAKCFQLNKPINAIELTQSIQKLLPETVATVDVIAGQRDSEGAPVIFVVDDDRSVREMLRAVLEDDGHGVEDFASCEEFLVAYRPDRRACLLLDAHLPGMKGLDLLHQLAADRNQMPVVLMTGESDVGFAVEAMKAGAVDFIEKPMNRADLLLTVGRALELSADSTKRSAWRESSVELVASLTTRQRQIMDLVLAGHPSKNIAADLNISQRTVENHRAAIMAKTGSKSLPALARLAIAAE